MRVVAGTLGGRTFDSPGTNRTHPMSDKVRGALFNMLGELDGLTVLDAFAGTGALSFEAISRGATSALAVERDTAAQQTITQNIARLELAGQVRLVAAMVGAWMQTNPDAQFDIVLCDPPYDDLQADLLVKLAERVKPGGLLVLSWPGAESVPAIEGLKQIEQRGYGDIQLVFYRKLQ